MPESVKLQPVPDPSCTVCGGSGTKPVTGGTCDCVVFTAPRDRKPPRPAGKQKPTTLKDVIKVVGIVAGAHIINETFLSKKGKK